MKKLWAMMLALALAPAVCVSAFAEAEDTEWVDFPVLHPEALAFESNWVSGDAMIRINGFCRLDAFEMHIVEMTGENTFNSWEYIMDYDDEQHKLICNGIGLKAANTFDAEGMITESVTEYEDGNATFFLNEDGDLSWDDEKEDTFQATVFHKIGSFTDVYVCDRATLRVQWAGEDLIYDVWLDWADSAFASWSWALAGNYDPATDTLPLDGFKLLYTYLENGDLDLNADQHETEVTATFTLDENDYLHVASDDETIDGLLFERTWLNMWQWEF